MQVIPAQNSPKDIESYKCKQNKTKLIKPLYELSTGKFFSLDLRLSYIVLMSFFNYDFNAETSKVLFSTFKDKIPNAFASATFKRHYNTIADESYTKKMSGFFFYILSTTDRKESINKYKDNVLLNSIDFVYENFKNFSHKKMNFNLNI